MKVREIINSILVFILAIVVIVIMIFLIQKYVFKRNLPSIFGYSIVRIDNNDMHPTFEIGDIILIIEEPNYDVGDIVVKTKDDGKLVTQRIIDIKDINVITKGDNLIEYDDTIDINSISGKMIYKFPPIFRNIKLWHIIICLLVITTVDCLIKYLIYKNSKYELKRW